MCAKLVLPIPTRQDESGVCNKSTNDMPDTDGDTPCRGFFTPLGMAVDYPDFFTPTNGGGSPVFQTPGAIHGILKHSHLPAQPTTTGSSTSSPMSSHQVSSCSIPGKRRDSRGRRCVGRSLSFMDGTPQVHEYESFDWRGFDVDKVYGPVPFNPLGDHHELRGESVPLKPGEVIADPNVGFIPLIGGGDCAVPSIARSRVGCLEQEKHSYNNRRTIHHSKQTMCLAEGADGSRRQPPREPDSSARGSDESSISTGRAEELYRHFFKVEDKGMLTLARGQPKKVDWETSSQPKCPVSPPCSSTARRVGLCRPVAGIQAKLPVRS